MTYEDHLRQDIAVHGTYDALSHSAGKLRRGSKYSAISVTENATRRFSSLLFPLPTTFKQTLILLPREVIGQLRYRFPIRLQRVPKHFLPRCVVIGFVNSIHTSGREVGAGAAITLGGRRRKGRLPIL